MDEGEWERDVLLSNNSKEKFMQQHFSRGQKTKIYDIPGKRLL